MKTIQILGPGCPKCRTLYAHAEAAVKATAIEARIEKVEKIADIMKFGVLITPGLAVDGQVKSAGKVLSVDEIKGLLAPVNAAVRVLSIAAVVTAAAGILALKAGKEEAPTLNAVLPTEAPALPRLVDLGAKKCIPCKMMAPILEDLTTSMVARLRVEFIDVWEKPEAAEPYKIDLIPTQIFFAPDGQELFRHEGYISKEDILGKWEELGFRFGTEKEE